MERQPGHDPEDPDPEDSGAEDDGSDFGTWEELEGTLAAAKALGELLGGFEPGGTWDQHPPDPELAAALWDAAGRDGRYGVATGQQLFGILGRMAALQSSVSAGILGVLRALIRDDALADPGRARHGDLPDEWDEGLTHEVALALAVSVPSATKTMRAAWELGARLPGVDLLLKDGTLDLPRARLIAEVFQDLSDQDAATAEALLLPHLTEPPRKTYTQVERLATAIAVTVDPELAERQRQAALKHRSRVTMFREQSGTAGLSGRDLPIEETLAAYAALSARADQYRDSGAFPDELIDRLRSAAFLDLLNAVSAEDRIAYGRLSPDDEPSLGPDGPGGPDGPDGSGGSDGPGGPGGSDGPGGPDSPGGDGPDAGPGDARGPDPGPRGSGGGPGDAPPRNGGGGPGNGPRGVDGGGPCDSGDPDPGRHSDCDIGCGPGERGPGADGGDSLDGPPASDRLATATPPQRPPLREPEGGPWPKLTELVVPLATLLGLARRPGEGHGLGTLDPGMCRALAATAALSPHTTLCVTITNRDGIAIGHGCAKLSRVARPPGGPPPTLTAPPPPLVALSARINLTITADRLTELRPPPLEQRGNGWLFCRDGAGPPGDPDWCGRWALVVPTGVAYDVRIEPMPTFDCDHRNESHAYRPNGMLRHLVQVRDYTCTFPSCNRHARESDFEHAVPYDQGGRTCACNAGARSRQCHRVKQSPGWNVTQPMPGWHQWRTPHGRGYTQGPKRYPV